MMMVRFMVFNYYFNILQYSELVHVGYDPTVYTTSEGEGMVELNISVFSHPVTGTPRPFTLSVTTHDSTAGIYVS